MSENNELIAELRNQVKDARDDAAKRRKKNQELTAQVAQLTRDLDAANGKVADLEVKVGKNPTEAQTRIDQLTGQVRDLKHKAKFREVALAEGVRPNAIDTAWGTLGLKAEADEPDAEAFKAALGAAKESHDFLFGPPASDAGSPPPPPKALGGSKGPPAGQGIWRTKESDHADPVWCQANDKRLKEAKANGTLEIVPG